MTTTPTTNYGFLKPTVGDDIDAWGADLNTSLDSIDTTIKAVSSAIPLASSTTPAMDGTAAVGTASTWAKADHVHPVDTSRYSALNPLGFQTAAQVIGALPVASSTTPVMDGTAAIGVGTTFARADHKHPTDTSLLPLSGGSMSGPIIAPADPTTALGLATKQYVDNGRGSGFINKFRNGTFDVWQRGTGSISSGIGSFTMTSDGWGVLAVGQSLSVQQGFAGFSTLNSLEIIGGTSNTAAILGQRIEASVAAPLSGQQVTVQFLIYNLTSATVTPVLTVLCPSTTKDVFSSLSTVLASVNLQPCPVSVWTRVAYTFPVTAAQAQMGLEIRLYPTGAGIGNGQAVLISEADIRATPGVATGLNNTPPSPELRHIAIEQTICARYYQLVVGNNRFKAAAAAEFGECSLNWPAMRGTPTATFISLALQSNLSSNLLNSVTNIGARMTTQATAAADCYAFGSLWSLNAEL